MRHLGVRVRHPDGSLPGLPPHLAIGSVSEDTEADSTLWRSFGSGRTNTRVDLRYLYLNGGPFLGWYGWAGGNGNRARGYIRESRKLGFLPFFVYYNIPDGGESYWIDPTDEKAIGPDAKWYKFDVAEAKKLMSAAGINGPIETKFHFPVGFFAQPFEKKMEVLHAMWQDSGPRVGLIRQASWYHAAMMAFREKSRR